MTLITLLTDFGTDSPYVAAMKGVMLAINPLARIVDISHAVPPQDVRHAALVLDQVCPYFPQSTVHVAVVDPGVGTERALIYAEIAGQRFIGPDNGLFSRLARRSAPRVIIALENRRYWSPQVSATFHGRDIMAPVAAFLTLGVDPALLGPRQSTLVEFAWPAPILAGRAIGGQIIAIDSFGNAITNISREDLAVIPQATQARAFVADRVICGISRTYGDRLPDELVALISSSEMLEVAVVCGNAAQRYALKIGDEVRVEW
jgi:S-adenosylmethionine hydrolase